MAKGRYSLHLKCESLRKSYERFLDDPNVKDLTDEIALNRAVLESVLASVANVPTEKLTANALSCISQLSAKVAEMVDRFASIEVRIAQKFTPTDLLLVIGQVFDIIKANVADPVALERIGVELEQISVPAPSE